MTIDVPYYDVKVGDRINLCGTVTTVSDDGGSAGVFVSILFDGCVIASRWFDENVLIRANITREVPVLKVGDRVRSKVSGTPMWIAHIIDNKAWCNAVTGDDYIMHLDNLELEKDVD